MTAIVLDRIVRVLSLAWLTGPIFDKEMRVSSRRRRNYVLRFLYVGLFTFLLALVWAEMVPYGSTWTYQSSRMALAGQAIVNVVLWFEFITVQAIAAVMLSTAISEEISHRTLGVLMTTPIGSFQIVVGKLLSRLLQLLLLLGISLPLLAVVRVFGGVPWNLLLCGLCVTLTTALFVGSLSLFFSIFTRRAYAAILTTLMTLGLLFVLIPLLAAILKYYPQEPPAAFWHGLSYVNPVVVLVAATASTYGSQWFAAISWPGHCGVMLGASCVVLLLAMASVRKAALRQAMGQTGVFFGRISRRRAANTFDGYVARVVGPPVLWKDCRVPLLGRRRVMNAIGGIALVGLLGWIYVLCAGEGILDDGDVQAMYMVFFFAIGMLVTTVVPATCIASEMESQTWPLLLTTSVGEWEILAGKFGGVVRRCAPIWALLFGHMTFFAIVGHIHPVGILQLGLIVLWAVIFLSCTGLHFSLRFRHTTTAVIANLATAAGLWAIFPLMLAIVLAVSHGGTDVLEPYLDMNPFVQAAVVAEAAGHEGSLSYEWAQGTMYSAADATAWILLTVLVHGIAGLAVAAWTGLRLRRNPI